MRPPREPYAVGGRVVVEDPHVADFGTDEPGDQDWRLCKQDFDFADANSDIRESAEKAFIAGVGDGPDEVQSVNALELAKVSYAPGQQVRTCPGCDPALPEHSRALVDTGDGVWAHAIGVEPCGWKAASQ